MFVIDSADLSWQSLLLLGTCSTLTVLYGALWLWLRKQQNVDFAKTLTLCMMGFNLFIIVRFVLALIVSPAYCSA